MSHPPADSPLHELLQRVDARSDGAPTDTVATGFPSLDSLLGGGLRRGDLVILGGDVAAGKSALALAIALRAAERGSVAAVSCGETSPERVLERALAIEGRASIDDLRAGTADADTRAELGKAAHRLRGALPHVLAIGDGGVQTLAGELRGIRDLELAVVDSLASLPTGAAPRDEEIATAARELKRLAVDAGIVVLATAHLVGSTAARGAARPTLDDFGALGVVKQQADVLLAIYREEMYQPGMGNEGGTELHILKNRNGPTAYVDLYFYKRWLRFEDMLDPDR